MDTSTGIMVIAAVSGFIVVLAAYRFIAQRRQLSSGKIIGRFLPAKKDGSYVFDQAVIVSAGGKWCRLLLRLESAEAYRMRYSPKYLFENSALVIGTPFTLTLKDDRNQVVHTETGTLEPFIRWLWGRHGGTETAMSERSEGKHDGTVTILEFLPKNAGRYFIRLEITGKVSAENPGSSSSWEVVKTELTVMEDVIPLSKTVSYPHKRVHL